MLLPAQEAGIADRNADLLQVLATKDELTIVCLFHFILHQVRVDEEARFNAFEGVSDGAGNRAKFLKLSAGFRFRFSRPDKRLLYRPIQLFGAAGDFEESAAHVIRDRSHRLAQIAVVLPTAALDVGKMLFQDVEQRSHDVVTHLGRVGDLLRQLAIEVIAKRDSMFTDGIERLANGVKIRPVRKAILIRPFGEIGSVGIIKRVQQSVSRTNYVGG